MNAKFVLMNRASSITARRSRVHTPPSYKTSSLFSRLFFGPRDLFTKLSGMASSSFLALLFAVLATAKGQLSDYPEGYPDGYPDGYPGEVGPYQVDGPYPGDGPYLGDGPVVGGAGLYPGDGPYPDPYPGDGPYPDGEGVYPGPDIYPTDGYPTDYEGGYNIRYGNPYKDPHVRDPRKYRHGYQYGLSPEDIAFIIREKAFPANMHIVPRTLY